MFRWFEKRIHPYPLTPPSVLPKQFFAFIWQASKGTRLMVIGLTVLTAMIGVFEDDMIPYGAYIAMKTAQNNVVPWLASQTDVLAEDWYVC